MGHLAPGGECVRYDVGVAVVMAQIIVRAASTPASLTAVRVPEGASDEDMIDGGCQPAGRRRPLYAAGRRGARPGRIYLMFLFSSHY